MLALFLFAVNLQAQTKQLELKDAINYALENKAEAKKAKLEVENSNYKIEEVRSQALPQLTLNGGLNYNAILQQTALPGELIGKPGQSVMVAFGQKWNSTASAQLTQQIFNQQVFTGLKAARSTREFYQINQQLTEEQLIEKVATNYFQVYVTQVKLKNVESNLETTKKVFDILNGQYKSGLARKIDVDRMQVNVSNIEAAKQQLINSIELQKNALKFFIGMPMNEAITLPEQNIELTDKAFVSEVKTDSRTEVALLKKQEELLVFQKKAYQAEYYPTLSLNANYGYQGLGNEFPWFAGSDKGVFWSNFSSYGLNLRVPVFNGFATRSKVRQADVSLKKLQADIDDTNLGLNYAFENAKTQIQNSIININTQKQNVKLSEDVLENTQNNYKNGLATLTDLLDAEKARTEAQNNYTSALLDYKLAEIQIYKSQGELQSLKN